MLLKHWGAVAGWSIACWSSSIALAEPDRLHVRHSSTQDLVLPPTASDGCEFDISLDGVEHRISLRPFTIRADGFELWVQTPAGLYRAVAPEPCTCRGEIVGLDGSSVCGSLSPAGLRAVVRMPDGREWGIEPTDGATHTIYSREDTDGPEVACATVHEGEPTQSFVGRGTGLRILDLAIDLDAEYVEENNGSVGNTLLDAESVWAVVSEIYERDVSIRFELSTAIVRDVPIDDDPYVSTSSTALLDEFRTEWNTGFPGIIRDVAHLMTGRNLNGSFVGVAEPESVCSTGIAYSLAETTYTTNIFLRRALTAHEIGHQFGATHCNSLPTCEIMCSSIGGCGVGATPEEFGVNATSQIAAYRDSFDADCLLELAPPITLPFEDRFSSQELDTDTWIFIDGPRTTTFASNEPSQSRSLEMNAEGPGIFDQDELRSNEIQLGEVADVTISFFTEHQGVEAGEELVLEVLIVNNNWLEVLRLESTGADQNFFTPREVVLPGGLFDSMTRLRFFTEVDETNDRWYIDNLNITATAVPVCPCEMDDNGEINITDLLLYLELWFSEQIGAERDGDGTITVADLLIFLDCLFDAFDGVPCP